MRFSTQMVAGKAFLDMLGVFDRYCVIEAVGWP
jgi:hypothetical protein